MKKTMAFVVSFASIAKERACNAFAMMIGAALAFSSVQAVPVKTDPDSYPVSKYVQDGLVVLFDAKDNVAPGVHDSESGVWVDLKGGHNVQLADGDVFSGDSFFLGNVQRECLGDIVAGNADLTVQFYAEPVLVTGAKSHFISIPYLGSVGWGTGSSGTVMSHLPSEDATDYVYEWPSFTGFTGADSLKGVYRTYTCYFYPSPNNTRVPFYYDTTASGAKSGYWQGNKRGNSRLLTLGAEEASENIRTIRIYNRRLSPVEIAQNCAVDKSRYGLANAWTVEPKLSRYEWVEGSPVPALTLGSAEHGTVTCNHTEKTLAALPAGRHEVEFLVEGVDGYRGLCRTYEVVVHGAVSLAVNGSSAEAAFPASDLPRELLLAMGDADNGMSLSAWDAVQKVADVSVGAAAAVFSMPAGFGTSYKVVRAFLRPSGLSAASYVQTGLVSQFDAIENAGLGHHNAAATAWSDLCSADNAIQLLADDRVGDQSVMLIDAHSSPQAVLAAYKEGVTMEAFASVDANANISMFLQVPDIGALSLDTRATKSGMGPVSVSRPVGDGVNAYVDDYKIGYDTLQDLIDMPPRCHSYSVTPGKGGGTAENTGTVLFFDGQEFSRHKWLNYTGKAGSSGLNVVLGAAGMRVTWRSVRVYDRSLSETERAHNRLVDRARFEGSEHSVSPAVYAQVPLTVVNIEKEGNTPTNLELAFPGSDHVRDIYVAWSRKDLGDDVTSWANVCKIGSVPPGTVAQSVAVPAEVGSNLVTGGFRIFLVYAFTTRDYVQKGLSVQYDAIENAGVGRHDANARTWAELVQGCDLALLDGDLVSDSYMKIAGAARKTTKPVFSDFVPATVEADMAILKVGSLNQFLGVPGIMTMSLDTRRVTNGKDDSVIDLARPADRVPKNGYFINSFKVSGTPFSQFKGTFQGYSFAPGLGPKGEPDIPLYVNGKLTPSDNYLNWQGNTYDPDLKLSLGETGDELNFRSIRFYDRNLTADERHWNLSVDQSRFYGVKVVSDVSDFTKANRFGLFVIVQ